MASKTIKGLTVEIGGDTTKLGNALKDVEAKSRNLSKELGDINKLLKLDPGNTELLAQKQKVLAEAVENTGRKLQTLKDAEKQVQEQFKRGEVSEEQVRALQREIVVTENKMKGYEKAAKETADAMKDLGDASDDVQDGTKKAKKGAEGAEKGFEEMADAADKAGDSSDGLGSKLGGLAKGGLKAVAGALTAVAGGLVGAAEATREYRADMAKLDTAFTMAGHTSEAATETYKTLQGVLGDSGQAVEAANHLAQLCDTEEDLATWTEIATGAYALFGDSLPIEGLTEAANESAKTGTVTGSLADALNWASVSSTRWSGILEENEGAQKAFNKAIKEGASVEDAFNEALAACATEQERAALITDALSGAYQEEAWAFQEANAEVIRANEANEAWTASMAEAGAAVEPILTDVKLLGASLLSDLLPGITGVTDAFRGMLNGDEGAAEELGAALSGIITQLLDKILELLPVMVDTAISLITTLTTTIISNIPQFIQVGFQLLTSLWTGIMQAVPQIIQALADMLPQLVTVLTTNIPVLLTSVVNSLQANLPALIAGVVQLVTSLVEALPVLLEVLLPMVPSIIESICTTLAENAPVLLDAVWDLLVLLVTDVVPQLIGLIIENYPKIYEALYNGLIDIMTSIGEWFDQLFIMLGEWFTIIWTDFTTWLTNIGTKAGEGARDLVQKFMAFMQQLPGKLGNQLKQGLERIANWAVNAVAKAKEAGSKFLTTVVNFFQQLPGKIWTWLQNAINKVSEFGVNAVSKAKTAAKNILDAVVNGIKALPEKVKTIGTNLVQGLWNGINDMTGWVKDKISGFSSNVLEGIKNFFGVHSPSRETAWIGEMLDRGLAQGVLDNIDAPLNAMADVADGMLDEAAGLNGVTLERQLSHTFNPVETPGENGGLLGKLDSILAAIERGQILTIDGDYLVGATVDRFDSRLGQRRALVARGAM